MADNFYDAVTGLIGVPESFGASVIIYTLLAIIFLWVLEMVFNIIFTLIRKV